MKQEEKIYIIVCDSCGEEYLDGHGMCSYVGDTDGSNIEQSALSSEWIGFGDRHYCPKCWTLDKENRYHTKDGKVWDAETCKEIK